MSSKRRDPDYCSDMLEAMQRIIAYAGGISYEQFMEDRRTSPTPPSPLTPYASRLTPSKGKVVSLSNRLVLSLSKG